MPKDPKVLILTASYGDGHLQVAHVLQSCFAKQGVKHVHILDLFAEAHPFINDFMRYVYIKSFSIAPSVYGWIYSMSRDMKHDQLFAKLLNSFGMQKLRKILENERPDLVLHTFPVSAMPELRLKAGIDIPTFSIITDFALHQRWIHPEIDKYYVATDDLKQEMIDRKIPANKIMVSGIPIRKSFDSLVDAKDIYQKYQLNPFKKTVLVMAGAYGVLRNIKQICQSLVQDGKFQVVLVCGKNETLLNEMKGYFTGWPSVMVLGFVKNIHELMGIASCMVTKAGGVTLSEAITYGLPTIIFRPVPGQEKENSDYLTEKGAAMTFYDIKDFQEQLVPLLHDNDRLSGMRQASLLLRRKWVTETIVTDILEEISQASQKVIKVK